MLRVLPGSFALGDASRSGASAVQSAGSLHAIHEAQAADGCDQGSAASRTPSGALGASSLRQQFDFTVPCTGLGFVQKCVHVCTGGTEPAPLPGRGTVSTLAAGAAASPSGLPPPLPPPLPPRGRFCWRWRLPSLGPAGCCSRCGCCACCCCCCFCSGAAGARPGGGGGSAAAPLAAPLPASPAAALEARRCWRSLAAVCSLEDQHREVSERGAITVAGCQRPHSCSPPRSTRAHPPSYSCQTASPSSCHCHCWRCRRHHWQPLRLQPARLPVGRGQLLQPQSRWRSRHHHWPRLQALQPLPPPLELQLLPCCQPLLAQQC